MTHFEYDLAFRAVIGLAGCAMAFVAVTLDWLEQRAFESWRDETLEVMRVDDALAES